AELATAPTVGTGRTRGTLADAGELTIVPVQRLGASAETHRLLEDTLPPAAAARPASARVPSAATVRAERQGAIRRAEAPALVAAVPMGVAVAADSTVAAVAGIGNYRFIPFRVDREILKWR